MNGKIYVYFNKKKYEEEGIERYYVGQTVREISHRSGKNGSQYTTNPNSKIARAIKKWGWESFEVIILEDNITNQDELNKLEIYYIEKYNSYEKGYNSTKGGEGQIGRIYSDEAKRKMSISHLGQIPALKGKKMSKEACLKMSKAKKGSIPWNKGKELSQEHKQKLKDNAKINPNYGRKNKKASDETKKKMSEANSWRWTAVKCVELDMEFGNTRLAVEYIKDNFNVEIKQKSNIFLACQGKRKHCGMINLNGVLTRLTWEYVKK